MPNVNGQQYPYDPAGIRAAAAARQAANPNAAFNRQGAMPAQANKSSAPMAVPGAPQAAQANNSASPTPFPGSPQYPQANSTANPRPVPGAPQGRRPITPMPPSTRRQPMPISQMMQQRMGQRRPMPTRPGVPPTQMTQGRVPPQISQILQNATLRRPGQM